MMSANASFKSSMYRRERLYCPQWIGGEDDMTEICWRWLLPGGGNEVMEIASSLTSSYALTRSSAGLYIMG